MRAMLVKDVGEFDLIDALAESLGASATPERGGLRLSIGDDAAAWEATAGPTVMTTDALVEGVHFDLAHIAWRDLGWKSLAVNQSDVAAMGCQPLYSEVTLGLRGDLPVDGLREMYRGMAEAAGRYGGQVVGGDTVRSPVLFISVAMVGVLPAAEGDEQGGRLLTRNGASPGDVVAVTGSVGCSGGGLRMLTRGLAFDDETVAHLRNAHERPTPRVSQGAALARLGATAAIDVSDGLVEDLGKLCGASRVGATIRSDRVPADEYLRRAYPDGWLSLALSGGEDYELLFTAPSAVMNEIRSAVDVPVSVIGEVVSDGQGVTVVDQLGTPLPVETGGWDHFR